MGTAPHLLYQAAQDGSALLIGGCPPLSPSWWGVLLTHPPPPSAATVCRVLGAHAARGGAHPLASWYRVPPLYLVFMLCAGIALFSGGYPVGSFQVFPPPSPPSLHTMRWKPTLFRGCPILFILVWGFPPLPSHHAMLYVYTLNSGGTPLPPLSVCARRMRVAYLKCPPLPPARAQVACAAKARGALLPPTHGLVVRARAAMFGGPPPVTRCVPWARAAGWGGPPPLYPP